MNYLPAVLHQNFFADDVISCKRESLMHHSLTTLSENIEGNTNTTDRQTRESVRNSSDFDHWAFRDIFIHSPSSAC